MASIATESAQKHERLEHKRRQNNPEILRLQCNASRRADPAKGLQN